MAQRQPDDEEDDTLELTPDMVADEGPDDESEEGGEGEEEEPDKPDEGDEVEGPPAFEDAAETGEEGDNAVIRRMRERVSELNRENAELRRAQPPPSMELPPKPTLAEVDYDEEEFETRLEAWNKRKRQIEDAETERASIAEQANREWQQDLQGYTRRVSELKLADFDDAAEIVKGSLTLPQQAVIVKAASDAPAFVYALAHSDARLAELAKIHDPIKLAAAIARMEGAVKVVRKRKAPAPDKPAAGIGRLPGSTDKQLSKLEEEANRTGDRTKLIAYRKKLKARSK